MKRPVRAALALALALALGAGCGFGFAGDEGGGGSNLPTAGIGPYGKLAVDLDTPIDEPIILADSGGDLLEPTLLVRGDGGFIIFLERRADSQSEIWRAEIPAITALPDVPLQPALTATLAWQGGEVRAPSASQTRDGEIVLAYEAGDPPAIGLATSSDGGASFAVANDPVIEDARAPSLTILEGTSYLFYERPAERGIFVAISEDGLTFEPLDERVLEVGLGPDAFDRAAVERPAAIARRTAAGRLRFDLFYQGRTGVIADGDPEIAIGYAGGFDLADLSRSAPLGEPVLSPGAPSEEGPAVALEAIRGVMLYVDRSSARARIGAATSP